MRIPCLILALTPLTGAAQLVLPYSGTDPSATISSFQIRKTGPTGRANTLYVTTPTNASDVLLVNTVGLGRAGYFQLNNPASTAQALRADANNAGISMFGLMTGMGRAGVFRIINSASTNHALYVDSDSSGAAMKVQTTGALAAWFANSVRIDAPNDGANGLEVQATGSGLVTGVLAVVSSSAPATTAVSGSASSPTGNTFGAYFESESNAGVGVAANVGASSGSTVAVRATAASSSARAISANASSATGITYGVYAQAASTSGRAVFGWATASTGSTTGVAGSTSSDGGQGVSGNASSPSGPTFGGYFSSASSTGTGSAGVATDSTGVNYGVYGETLSLTNGYGVYSKGRFAATGTKAFRIDHPLDPENKELNHYCAEGPEPLNLYRGSIVTDERGFATIQMPDYYEAINRDPTIQLTVVDETEDFVQVKVARRLIHGRFTIRTSKPKTEVYWEVQSVRNDRFVRTYGAPVEVDKPQAKRGTYLQPEFFRKVKSSGR